MSRFSFQPDRLICDVFREMRTCIKTRNFSYLRGLVEEAQSYANRMESALEAIDTEWEEVKISSLKDRKDKLRKEIAQLEKEVELKR